MFTKEKSSLTASLFNGDCLEKMRNIPDKSVDLIVTDPPYIMNYKSNRSKKRTINFLNLF